MRAAHFDDSAPRRPEDRAQLAAMLAAAAEELDSTGPYDGAALEPVPLQPEPVAEGSK